MFKFSESGEDGGGGPATGIAALTAAQFAPDDAARAYLSTEPNGGNPARLANLYRKFEVRARRIDWTPDLAEEIGSKRWFRGLGTLIGLAGIALACWPDFSSVQAATTMPLDPAALDEFRSQAIRPLAMGADSGRHMGVNPTVLALASVPERPSLDLTATLGQGDNLARMLARAGIGTNESERVAALIAAKIPLAELRPGTRFAVTLGRRTGPGQARVVEKIDFRARFDLALGIVRSNGALVAVEKPIAVDSTPLRIRGVIGQGLYRSARAAGAPIEAIQQYLQALDAHLSLDVDLQPGDTFDLIVGYKRSAAGEVQVGDLQFAGLERAGKSVAQLLRWGGDGQFFEAAHVGQRRTGLIMPVVGRITSGFGSRRHPVLGYTRMHSGVDFGAPYGSPIYAVGDATVSYAGWHGGHGNFVRLEHGGGFGTGYGHMSRIAVGVGSRVRAGQVIGYVGSTGLSTGPHLHYELYRNGVKVNPLSVKFTVTNSVDENELSAFRARMATLKAVVPGAALARFGTQSAASPAPVREIGRLGN